MIAGAMALFPADAGAANYAHFALLPGTAAIIWARRGTLLMALAAGVAIGIAILCRQSWLLGVVPACVSIGLHGRWRNVAPFLAAAAATVATTGFYAPLGRFWEWNVTNSPGFVFAGTSVWSALGSGLASVAGFAAFHPVVTVAVGVVSQPQLRQSDAGHCLTTSTCGCGLPRASPPGRQGCDSSATTGCRSCRRSCCSRFPSLPVGPSRSRTAAIVGVAVPAVAAWVLLFVPGSFHNRPDPDALASYVRSHTTAADRVFVWGSYPEVLVAADRLPAGGLVHTDFVVGRSGGRNDPAKTLSSAVPGALDIMMRSADRKTRRN